MTYSPVVGWLRLTGLPLDKQWYVGTYFSVHVLIWSVFITLLLLLVQLNDMMTRALHSKDEVFHVCLYNWMLTEGLADLLIEVCAYACVFKKCHVCMCEYVLCTCFSLTSSRLRLSRVTWSIKSDQRSAPQYSCTYETKAVGKSSQFMSVCVFRNLLWFWKWKYYIQCGIIWNSAQVSMAIKDQLIVKYEIEIWPSIVKFEREWSIITLLCSLVSETGANQLLSFHSLCSLSIF